MPFLSPNIRTMDISGTVQQKTTSSFRVDGWTGDIAELKELSAVCRNLLEKARKDLRDAFELTVEARRVEYARRMYSFKWDEAQLASSWKARDAEVRVRADEALELTLNARELKLSRELKGSPEHVLDQIDARDVRGLRFLLGEMYGDLAIGFSIDFDRNRGCQVEIVSCNRDFVLVATDALRPVLTRRRPWYWWVRSNRIGTVLWILPMLFLEIASTYSLVATKGPLALLALLLSFTAIDMFAALGIMFVVRAVLPGFEVFRVGERARGARIFAVAGAALFWAIPIAIPYFVK